MTKTRIIMLVSFVVVFAAGVAAGLLLAGSARLRHRGSWLARELNLTPEQQKQMREIWSEPDQRLPMHGYPEQRRAMRKSLNEAMQALLTEEQKARYDELVKEYEQQLAKLNEERRKAFEDKIERTKKILTESQREKYDELLEKGRGLRGRPGGGPGREASRENRKAAGAEVQDSPHGQEKSLKE